MQSETNFRTTARKTEGNLKKTANLLTSGRQMATKKRVVAPITVYTNGNKFDSKRFIFNPKYVRTFDALLDELTQQTNATCAVRKIYTPHGSRQVGNLSGIQPGGRYVAVSRGTFKKVPYGQGNYATSSERTPTTTKTARRRKLASGRLQRSYEDQMNTQKTIYVHRNGYNEPPAQIFFTKRLLRNMDQVLDLVQEKIIYERPILSLHKLSGLTVDNVSKLQAEGRYVAVEQGQRFRRIIYDHVDADTPSSPRRQKLPAIKPGGGFHTGRIAPDAKPRQRLPSDENSQGQANAKGAKPKDRLPAIKQQVNEPAEFEFTYGYPKKDPNEGTRSWRFQHAQRQESTHQGVFYASGAQRHIGTEIRDDKRVRVERPLDMMNAREVEEKLDHVNFPKKARDQRKKTTQTKSMEKQTRQPVALPQIVHAPKPPNDTFPTKPSIAHPHRHTADKYKRPAEKTRESREAAPVRKSLVANDQRFVSQENSMVQTKRYAVTREQRLFDMHGRDGNKPAKKVVQVYTTDVLAKDMERKSQQQQKRKRVEQWVDQTVEEKQKGDEIAAVAKKLVVTALGNAARTLKREDMKQNHLRSSHQNNNAPNFYDTTKGDGAKYHRVFGQ